MTPSRLCALHVVATLRRALLAIAPAIALSAAAPSHAATPEAAVADADKAAAVRALTAGDDHAQPDLNGWDQVVLAPWSHAPAGAGDVWVVAALIPKSKADPVPELWTGVLSRSGKDFRLIASSEHEDIWHFVPMLMHPSLQLDLIPYRLAPDDVAFGVRMNDGYDSDAHSDSYTGITLYHLAAGKLVPVFDAITTRTILDKFAADDCEKQAGRNKSSDDIDCDTANTSDEEYVLAFSPTVTQGHYDLLVRTRPAKGQPSKLVKRAVWNGTTYRPRSFFTP